MAKLTLTDIASLTNESTAITAINANSALIEAALEKTLTRDDNTTNPNAMSVDLQMGGFKVTNLGTPSASTDAATKAYVDASTGNDIGDITAAVAQAEAAAAAAEAAADEAAAIAVGYVATSTTSNSIGTGAKTFTVQTGKSYTAGQYVVVTRTSNPTTHAMYGSITSYTTGTGSLVLSIDTIIGSGTYSAWTVNLAGARGAEGAAGDGSGDVSTADNFPASGRVIVSAGTDKTVDETSVSISGAAVTGVSTLGASSTITVTRTGGTAFAAVGTNIGCEFGLPATASSPYLDFHSSGNSHSYDSRISASSGGASTGQGTLTITAATLAVTGDITEDGNPVINTAGGDNLTGGFTTTAYAVNSGVLDEGDDAYRVDPLHGYIQYYENQGAHTLLPPLSPGVCIIRVVNGTGSGAITFGDADDKWKATGDTYAGTTGHEYEFTIRKLNASANYALINILRVDNISNL